MEERRIRHDIIQVLKLMHNYDAEDRRQFFKTASIIPVYLGYKAGQPINHPASIIPVYLGRKLVNLLIILPV